jgi:hypothetical protein
LEPQRRLPDVVVGGLPLEFTLADAKARVRELIAAELAALTPPKAA